VARRFAIGDDIYTISDLEQVRALADPFRLKLLGAFGGRPKTTKQVAQQLGEKPTKLYHHVEALKRVGLLALKETRPNRGTVEKYYQAVATRFQIGAGLFATGKAAEPMADKTAAMLLSILDTTRAELAGALIRSAGGSESCSPNTAMVARMLLRGEPKRVEQFRARLLALLDHFKDETAGLESDQTDAYGLTLVFYPLPSPAPGGQPRDQAKRTAGETDEARPGAAKRRVSAGSKESASVPEHAASESPVTMPRPGQNKPVQPNAMGRKRKT